MGVKITRMTTSPLHINPELEIVFVRKGKIRVLLGKNGFDQHPGQFCIIPAYRLHGFEPSEDCDAFVFLFPISSATDFFNFCHNKDVTNHIFTPDEVTLKYILSATEALYERANSFLEKSILYTLLANFTENNTFTTMSFDSSNVNRIIEYIFLNIKENLSLKSVSTEFAITENQLSEMLSGYTGLSFKEFLTNMRVNNAMELLHKKDFNITEVAYESGFETTRTFNRAFMKIVGCTPTEYRKRL